MNGKYANRKNHAGFTLVEMLVVILIIAILAGLISAVAIQARKRAKAAAIGMEIQQLALALNQYKTKFGEYPPDFFGIDRSGSATDLAAKNKVLSHIAVAFPRLVISGADIATKWNNLRAEILTTTSSMVDIDTITLTLDPSTALRFWLGGMPDPTTGRPSGFSQDPAHPFDNTTASRIGPFFEFDPGRLPAQLGTYYPPGVPSGTGKPYVYFRAEAGQGHPNEYYLNVSGTYTFKTWPSVAPIETKPYWDERSTCWVNDTSYQILCCGLDGRFGVENVYPSGLKPVGSPPDVTGIVPGNFDHLDDQTNFSSGTIGDDMP